MSSPPKRYFVHQLKRGFLRWEYRIRDILEEHWLEYVGDEALLQEIADRKNELWQADLIKKAKKIPKRTIKFKSKKFDGDSEL